MEGFFNLAGCIGLFRLLLHDKVGGVDEVKRAAGAFAVIVNQATAGQGKDKGAEGAAGRVAWRGAVQFEEGLLGEIFGVGSVAGGAVEEVN